MLSYKYILLLSAILTTISIQLATAKKDEELSNNDIDTRQSSMTWSPTTAPPPNTPFPTYNSNTDLIPITSLSLPPSIPILPPEQCASNLPCSSEFTQCTDGTTESCCNNTYESFICNCETSLESGELQWMCYYTDACFIPSCDDENGGDEVVEIAIDEGEVSDALQSTLPVETGAPVSSPVTGEPTTANPTTSKVCVVCLMLSLSLSFVSLQTHHIQSPSLSSLCSYHPHLSAFILANHI